jgi:flagellar assembly protein FliH
MLCRVGSAAETAHALPVAWRRVGDSQTAASGEDRSAACEQALERCRVAEQRLAHLEQSMEPMRQDAWKQGYQAAHDEAQEAAQREIDLERQRLAEALGYMAQVRHEWRRQAEIDVVTLALAVARRVLHREIAIDPDALHGLVRVAAEKGPDQAVRRVLVAPSQAPGLRDYLLTAAPGVELAADVTLQPGDIRFEMTHGAIDASVDAQLQEIERGFADRLGR